MRIKESAKTRRLAAQALYETKLEQLTIKCGAEALSGNILANKLKRLESQAHKLAEDYCNGLTTEAAYDKRVEVITKKVQAFFNNNLKGFFVNGDPRGYALKIDDTINREEYEKEINLERDWGGYGLLAPVIN